MNLVGRIKKQSFLCLAVVLFICYVLLVENNNDKNSYKEKNDNHVEELVANGETQEINVFIILCLRLDGNGNFVSKTDFSLRNK